MASMYKHVPLVSSQASIRLFRLDSFTNGLLSGTLQIFNLADAPPYQALSYEWGAANEHDSHIRIDGGSYAIGRNLYDFLARYAGEKHFTFLFPSYQHISRSAFHTWLWIDQICIAQNDTAEKNTQVRMMSTIFQRAEHVIAWLGNDEVVAAAIGELRRIENDDQRINQRFFVLESCSYWARLWIVQELILARDLTVMCGQTHIKWEQLKLYHSLMYSPLDTRVQQLHTDNIQPGQMPLRNLIRWRDRPGDVPTSLSRLIHSFHLRKCSNPRDVVYGLSGLMQPSERVRLETDYNKPIDDVFLDALAQMLREEAEYPDLCPWAKQRWDSGVPARKIGILLSLADRMGSRYSRNLTELKARFQKERHNVTWVGDFDRLDAEIDLAIQNLLSPDRQARK